MIRKSGELRDFRLTSRRETFTVLGCYVALIYSYRRFGTTYNFFILKSEAVFWDCIALE